MIAFRKLEVTEWDSVPEGAEYETGTEIDITDEHGRQVIEAYTVDDGRAIGHRNFVGSTTKRKYEYDGLPSVSLFGPHDRYEG